MIAWIDGVMVAGTPEEIQRFRKVAAKKIEPDEFVKADITKLFKMTDDVPEHVKNYGKNKAIYESKAENKARVWF